MLPEDGVGPAVDPGASLDFSRVDLDEVGLAAEVGPPAVDPGLDPGVEGPRVVIPPVETVVVEGVVEGGDVGPEVEFSDAGLGVVGASLVLIVAFSVVLALACPSTRVHSTTHTISSLKAAILLHFS